ncbi:MAG: cbb3-type cytochrome c oxidase subunit 3 [Gammaproteobacteria bacterium]|nr:MAG: cbb3-type cytochrome c oxidase subunit 3 [Gammaproteobacteria bacterium]
MVWFHAFFTVFLFALFIAIVLWAFSPRRKKAFDEAARLPLEDKRGDHP